MLAVARLTYYGTRRWWVFVVTSPFAGSARGSWGLLSFHAPVGFHESREMGGIHDSHTNIPSA